MKEKACENNELYADCLGEFSKKYVNKKGRSLINFIQSRN